MVRTTIHIPRSVSGRTWRSFLYWFLGFLLLYESQMYLRINFTWYQVLFLYFIEFHIYLLIFFCLLLLLQIIMGLLQLGSLCVFLSEMLVSGFTTGAAVHVLTSQIKYIFGIQVQRYSGPFKILYVRIMASRCHSFHVFQIVCIYLYLMKYRG